MKALAGFAETAVKGCCLICDRPIRTRHARKVCDRKECRDEQQRAHDASRGKHYTPEKERQERDLLMRIAERAVQSDEWDYQSLFSLGADRRLIEAAQMRLRRKGVRFYRAEREYVPR